MNIPKTHVAAMLEQHRLQAEADMALSAIRFTDANLVADEKGVNWNAGMFVRAARARLATKRAAYWLTHVHPDDPTVGQLEPETARAVLDAVMALVEIEQ